MGALVSHNNGGLYRGSLAAGSRSASWPGRCCPSCWGCSSRACSRRATPTRPRRNRCHRHNARRDGHHRCGRRVAGSDPVIILNEYLSLRLDRPTVEGRVENRGPMRAFVRQTRVATGYSATAGNWVNSRRGGAVSPAPSQLSAHEGARVTGGQARALADWRFRDGHPSWRYSPPVLSRQLAGVSASASFIRFEAVPCGRGRSLVGRRACVGRNPAPRRFKFQAEQHAFHSNAQRLPRIHVSAPFAQQRTTGADGACPRIALMRCIP